MDLEVLCNFEGFSYVGSLSGCVYVFWLFTSLYYKDDPQTDLKKSFSPSPFTSPILFIFQMPLLHLEAKYWYMYSTHSWTVLNAKQYLHRLPFCSMKPSAYVPQGTKSISCFLLKISLWWPANPEKTSTIAASLEHTIIKDILTSATGTRWFYNKMRLRKDNSLYSPLNNNLKCLVNSKGHISKSYCWGEAFSQWLTKPFVLLLPWTLKTLDRHNKILVFPFLFM